MKCVAEVRRGVPESEAWSEWQRLEEGCRKVRRGVCGRGWKKGAGKRGVECVVEFGGKVPESEAWSVWQSLEEKSRKARLGVCGRGWRKGAGKRGLKYVTSVTKMASTVLFLCRFVAALRSANVRLRNRGQTEQQRAGGLLHGPGMAGRLPQLHI